MNVGKIPRPTANRPIQVRNLIINKYNQLLLLIIITSLNDKENGRYLLFVSLRNIPAHEEIVTCYMKDYWCRKIQWEKLDESGRLLAMEHYGINPVQDIID